MSKSVLRHLLTALGIVIGLVGLKDVVPVLQFLQDNLDQIWDSVVALIGVVTTIIGFFVGREK